MCKKVPEENRETAVGFCFLFACTAACRRYDTRYLVHTIDTWYVRVYIWESDLYMGGCENLITDKKHVPGTGIGTHGLPVSHKWIRHNAFYIYLVCFCLLLVSRCSHIRPCALRMQSATTKQTSRREYPTHSGAYIQQ